MGTLSTAYKGSVQALVAREFCLENAEGRAKASGQLLSYPEGAGVEAVLIASGAELARAQLIDGRFELTFDLVASDNATAMQIDIVQAGRHIGTFLLKREMADGSALSIAQRARDLVGADLRALHDCLGNSPSLQARAQKIIATMCATIILWRPFSQELATFAKDLFWHDRKAYALWHMVLSRYLAKAAIDSANSFNDKTVSNCLLPMELVLEHEQDEAQLVEFAAQWIGQMHGVPFWYRHRSFIQAIEGIARRAPGVNTRALLNEELSGIVAQCDRRVEIEHLPRYSNASRTHLRAQAQGALDNAQVDYSLLRTLDVECLDDLSMVQASLDALLVDAGRMPELIRGVLQMAEGLAGHARTDVAPAIKRLLEAVITKGSEAAVNALFDASAHSEMLMEHFMSEPVALAVARDSEDLRARYLDVLRGVIVPAPAVQGFHAQSWAEVVDARHLERLRGLMTVAATSPDFARPVLARLIANLAICGVLIPDDKLFQRDLTAYLNSEAMRKEPFLSAMLLRQLPAFHKDVGASGRLREISSDLDSWGNDAVLYFLRKQIHVNASNLNVALVERVLEAWALGSPEPLVAAVPSDVLAQLPPERLQQCAKVLAPALRQLGVLSESGIDYAALRIVDEGAIDRAFSGNQDELSSKSRLLLLLHKEILRKYTQAHEGAVPDIAGMTRELGALVHEYKSLWDICLSAERTVAQESLYFKRHIAFGIPSVIGSYSEPKFDAFTRLLHIEERMRVLMEAMLADAALIKSLSWHAALAHVAEFMRVQGVGNGVIDESAWLLGNYPLRASQAADLLRTWQIEISWSVEGISRTFHAEVDALLRAIAPDDLPDSIKRLAGEPEGLMHKASDRVLRSLVVSVPGLEEADRLLNAIGNALRLKVESGRDDLINDKHVQPRDIYVLHELSTEEAHLHGPLLGGKAKNLVPIIKRALRVPEAVTLPARAEPSSIDDAALMHTILQAVAAIERRTGLKYCDPASPLLLSVRSGSYVSMPGIMSSVLFCGMSEPMVDALSVRYGDSDFAWDAYRRFIEHYANVVHGVPDEQFDALRVPDARATVQAYLRMLAAQGVRIPVDGHEQLLHAARAVYGTWASPRALAYCAAMGVSQHWGTAVTITQMVYGNRQGSGTSVYFSRKPFDEAGSIFGETRSAASGDDVVYGKHRNQPIAKWQGPGSLEEIDAELYQSHRALAMEVEAAMGGLPQEIEVTYEGDKLYMLQTKRMEFRSEMAKRFHSICQMDTKVIGRGMGVHGGALSGVATFISDPAHIQKLTRDAAMPAILLAPETRTEDVHAMPHLGGLLTASGGVSSHAAILAQKFKLAAVVGCGDMQVLRDADGDAYASIGGTLVHEGEPVSIDGASGLVYSGLCQLSVQRRV